MTGVNLTTGQFNTGRDITLTVIGPNGNRVDVPNITGFQCKAIYADIKVDRLDGIQMNASLPKGWDGSFEAERGSPVLDFLAAGIETNWYNNGSYNGGQIYQTITECDGSVTTFAFSNVAFKLDDAGSWKGDASVKQKVSFMADRREAV